jgi:hypothetical protein
VYEGGGSGRILVARAWVVAARGREGAYTLGGSFHPDSLKIRLADSLKIKLGFRLSKTIPDGLRLGKTSRENFQPQLLQ